MANDSALPKFLQLAKLNPAVKPLGRALSSRIFQDFPQVPDCLLCLIAVLAEKVASGNVCLGLKEANIKQVTNQWLDANTLKKCQANADIKRIVSECSDYFNDIADCGKFIASIKVFLEQSDNAGNTLVLDDGDPLCERLYFRRYYLYERAVATFIAARNGNSVSFEGNLDLLAKAGEILFQNDDKALDWQKIAAMVALRSSFSVITGGPGTGKTTTLSKLLVLLLSFQPEKHRIMLAAPTGKAAARVTESIASAFTGDIESRADGVCRILSPCLGGKELDGKALLNLIPKSADTLHSLLKVIPHQDQPIFNAKRKLDCDIMVIDEVSMVDLPLFAKLCAALRDDTRVILLGDMDQLFSVEAGSVLADICNFRPDIGQSCLNFLIKSCNLRSRSLKAEFLDSIADGSNLLSEHTVKLSKSHRFHSGSGIFRLSRLVNEGKGDQALELLESCQDGRPSLFADLKFTPYKINFAADPASIYRQAQSCAILISVNSFKAVDKSSKAGFLSEKNEDVASYRAFFEYIRDPNRSGSNDFLLTAAQAQRAFAYLDSYRILCSNRKGVLGQDNLNALIGEKVRSMSAGYLQEEWYPGKVVMATKNDPALGLHNGDVGFAAIKADSGRLTVFFPGSGSESMTVNPVFLSAYEEGFAMTVHKSQGSEYAEVCLALSPYENPVLTKELLYTGITRAKRQVRIYGSRHIVKYACGNQVSRESGLTFRLSHPDLIE